MFTEDTYQEGYKDGYKAGRQSAMIPMTEEEIKQFQAECASKPGLPAIADKEWLDQTLGNTKRLDDKLINLPHGTTVKHLRSIMFTPAQLAVINSWEVKL